MSDPDYEGSESLNTDASWLTTDKPVLPRGRTFAPAHQFPLTYKKGSRELVRASLKEALRFFSLCFSMGGICILSSLVIRITVKFPTYYPLDFQKVKKEMPEKGHKMAYENVSRIHNACRSLLIL